MEAQHDRTTTASTGDPADFHIPGTNIGGGGVVTLFVSIVGGMFWLRRKLSRDNVEIDKDSKERELMTAITEERDRAVKAAEDAWSTREEDVKRIGELTGEVKHLTSANEALTREVTRMRNDVSQLKEVILKVLPAVLNMEDSEMPAIRELLAAILGHQSGAES